MRAASVIALALALASSSAGCLLVNDYDRFSRGGGGSDGGMTDGGVTDGGVTDGGAGDAATDAGDPLDACVPSSGGETCNGADDDCDGTVDESPRECGGANESTACVEGACQVVGCVEGWGNCTAGAGCETSIASDRTRCGGCDTACGALDVCREGSCATLDADWLVQGSSASRAWLYGVALRGDRVVAVGNHPGAGLSLGGESVSSQPGAFVTVRSRDTGAARAVLAIEGEQVALQRVVVDELGVIYVTGEYRLGSVSIGGRDLPEATFSNAFVAALSPALELEWVVRFHGAAAVLPTGLALDPEGDGVWFAATYVDGVSRDGTEVHAASGHGALVGHLHANGTEAFTRTHPWTENTTDADQFGLTPGGGYVLGGFVSEVETFSPTLTYDPVGIDAFVVAYDADGTHRWLYTLPTVGESYTLALAATEETVYAGVFVDGTSGDFAEQGGVVAIDASNGALRWQRPLGGDVETVHALAITPDGDVLVGGMAYPTVDIGTGTPTIRGMWDAMIALIGPDGTSTRWLYTFGGAERELVSALAVGEGGEVYAVGQFDGTMRVAGMDWSAAGLSAPDGFLLRLTP